jgi:hypothetical protein
MWHGSGIQGPNGKSSFLMGGENDTMIAVGWYDWETPPRGWGKPSFEGLYKVVMCNAH